MPRSQRSWPSMASSTLVSVLLTASCFASAGGEGGAHRHAQSGGSSKGRLDGGETFTEELLIRPLPDGNIMSHASMSMTWPVSRRGKDGGGHYYLFPEAIGEFVQLYSVGELHLTLSRGRWLDDLWGHSPIPAPQGAMLSAWVDPPSGDAQAAWNGLTNALGGLFGASLNFLESPLKHLHPASSLPPTSSFVMASLDGRNGSNPTQFFGTLPREVACTENLTPWLKLLPCRGEAGVAKALKGNMLCGALYSAYTVHTTLECGRRSFSSSSSSSSSPDCDPSSVYLSLKLSATWVSNASPDLFGSGNSKGVSDRGYARATAASFSIDKTMGINGGLGVCSVASSTRVHLHVPEPYNAVSGGTLSISASGRGSADPLITANAVTYDVGRDAESSGGLELNFTWALHDARALRLDAGGGLSRVTAHRYLTGVGGGIKGSLVLELNNRHESEEVLVNVMDTLPWYVRLYLHTARFVATGSEPVALSTVLVGKSSFKVAGIRKGMSVLEYSLVLPASSSSKVVIDFERAFLHIDEHPPDANRGFDLPSPIVTFRRLSDAPAEGAVDSPIWLSQSCSEVTGQLGQGAACLKDGMAMACLAYRQHFAEWKRGGPRCEASNLCSQHEELCVRPITSPLRPFDSRAPISDADYIGMYPKDVRVVYGESVLLVVPTPDFSMPYNVITLTCTVLALFYGSVFNILTRKLREGGKFDNVGKSSGATTGSPLGKLLGVFKGRDKTKTKAKTK